MLRYEAPVTPIVERYVQPTPLPGQPKKHTSPRKKRKGLKIFLFCMLGLLLVSGVVTALWLGGAFDDHRSYHDDDFEQRHDEDYYDNSEHGETTIKRLPNTDQVKLRYNESHGEALTIQEIYQKVNPSTVTVLTGNRDGSAMVGTGVIFTEDGYILTNAHVIAGGSECYVVLDTGEDYRACLLGLDEEKDLAVIKIAASGLPAAEFGDSDALTVGDPVFAIGNPLGVELRGTLTDGIVSAINRDVYVDGVTMTLIQTNAALNNGNSGGPLINVYGQVGMVHVRTNIRKQISKLAADVLADLCRCHREFLVAALGLDLKGLSCRKIGCQIVLCGRNDTLERLFRADRCTGDGRKAEHTACALHNRICVCIVRNLHINDRLAHGDLAVCNVRHAALEVFQQTVLKGFAVESLEDDLTALEQ